MALLRTRRIFGGSVTAANSWTLLYRVPTKKRAVLRDIRIQNASGVGSTFFLAVSINSGETINLIKQTLNDDAILSWLGDSVLHEADELVAYATGAPTRLYVSGAELDVP